MGRPFVLGRDHKLYVVPPSVRAPTSNPITSVPSPWRYFFANTSLDLTDYSTAGDLVEVPIVQDLTANLGNETTKIPSRAAGKWNVGAVVSGDLSFDFSVLWQPSNPIFLWLFDKWLDGCPITCLIADYYHPLDPRFDSSGGWCGASIDRSLGLWADFNVVNFDWNQPHSEPATADVSLEIGLGQIYPEAIQLYPQGTITDWVANTPKATGTSNVSITPDNAPS